jgi:hypothetical protein
MIIATPQIAKPLISADPSGSFGFHSPQPPLPEGRRRA